MTTFTLQGPVFNFLHHSIAKCYPKVADKAGVLNWESLGRFSWLATVWILVSVYRIQSVFDLNQNICQKSDELIGFVKLHFSLNVLSVQSELCPALQACSWAFILVLVIGQVPLPSCAFSSIPCVHLRILQRLNLMDCTYELPASHCILTSLCYSYMPGHLLCIFILWCFGGGSSGTVPASWSL